METIDKIRLNGVDYQIAAAGGEVDAYTKQEADNKFATKEYVDQQDVATMENVSQYFAAFEGELENKADKSDVPTVQVGNGTDKNYVYGAGVKVDYDSKYPYKGMPDSTTYHNVVAEIAGMASATDFTIYERQWGDDSSMPAHVITIPEVSDYDAGLMTPNMRNKLNSLEVVDTSSFATKEELEGKQDNIGNIDYPAYLTWSFEGLDDGETDVPILFWYKRNFSDRFKHEEDKIYFAEINGKGVMSPNNFANDLKFSLVESLDDTPLKMKRISQSDYDSLGSKDENTLYIITD